MPTLENVNKHRADAGKPLLSKEEYDARMRLKVVEPEPPSQRTLDIRAGLIDPNEPEKESKKKK